MKEETHPPYQEVLFVDSSSGHRFVCGSALQPQGREVFNGIEYPVYYLSISSTSHPFFTGSKQLVDSEGRVEKFKRRFERKDGQAETVPGSTPAVAKPAHPAVKPAGNKVEEKKVEKPVAKKTAAAPAKKADDKKSTEKKPAKPAKKG